MGSHGFIEEVGFGEGGAHGLDAFLQIDGLSVPFERRCVHLAVIQRVLKPTRGWLKRFCMTSVASMATGSRSNRDSGTIDLRFTGSADAYKSMAGARSVRSSSVLSRASTAWTSFS